jgi:hypothetical protein
MLTLSNIIKIAVLLAVAGISSFGTKSYLDWKWNEKLWECKVQLTAEQDKYNKREAEYAAAHSAAQAEQLELSRVAEEKYNEQINKAIENSAYWRKRASAGLFDPGKNGVCADTGQARGSPIPEGGAASGRLSTEAAEFLLAEAERADRAANYAASCRSWALSIIKGKADPPERPGGNQPQQGG